MVDEYIWMTLIYISIALILTETAFFFLFKHYLLRRANDISRRHSQPYRDYPIPRRHELFTRILQRIENRCIQTNKDFRVEFSSFLSRWFHETDSLKHSNGTVHFWKEELDEFFSWAFFDKQQQDLGSAEKKQLNYFYDILHSRHGIEYPRRDPEIHNGPFSVPRCMTLEPVNPLHRPFLVYFFAWVGKVICQIILQLNGFKLYVERDTKTSGKLVYWFRPANINIDSQKQETILFFHGIAPGGLLFYLPLLLKTFCNHAFGGSSKNIFLFLNDPIACTMSFEALSEQSTLNCIQNILQKHRCIESSGIGSEKVHIESQKLCLIGHSFGSCQVSWLLYCPFIRQHVRKVVLLDPVCILLSEPDVMLNFLYDRVGSSSFQSNKQKMMADESRPYSIRKLLIRMIASSELFTEHYLRRHFSWYNSELWLDDVPDDIDLFIYLSESDDIVNTEKIQQEILLTHGKAMKRKSHINWMRWQGVSHGNCLINPKLWEDIMDSWQQPSHNKQD